MNTANSSKAEGPTKLVTFVNGITGDLPFVSDAFRIERISEDAIAKWMSLKGRVA